MEMAVLKLKRIMQGILSAEPHEIGCDDCFNHLDAYVELVLAGENAAERFPELHDHLQRCLNCREEFDALMAALHGSHLEQ